MHSHFTLLIPPFCYQIIFKMPLKCMELSAVCIIAHVILAWRVCCHQQRGRIVSTRLYWMWVTDCSGSVVLAWHSLDPSISFLDQNTAKPHRFYKMSSVFPPCLFRLFHHREKGEDIVVSDCMTSHSSFCEIWAISRTNEYFWYRLVKGA